MKTTSYHTEKEIRFGIWFVLFTIAIFTTIKVKELQLNKIYNEEIAGSGQMVINHVNHLALPVLDAKLVEEPALKVETWMSSESYWGTTSNTEITEAEPALEVEIWMTNNEYWSASNPAETVESEPAANIESWMTDNNFWIVASNAEVIEAEPLLEIESWMKSNAYFTGTNAKETVETEPVLQIESWMMHEVVLNSQQTAIDVNETTEAEFQLVIESWMNSGAYWTGSEEQITSGNELANN